MPFPIVPALIGAAVGSFVTDLAMSSRFQRKLSHSVQDLGDSLESGARRAKRRVSDVADGAADTVKEATTAVNDTASKVVD